MKRFYLGALYMLFCFTTQLYSQETGLGSRITAMGNTGVALQDVWCLQSNQAGIAGLEKPIASVSYQSNYLNPDLSTQSAVLAYPMGRNVVGLSFQNYGFSAYSEQKIGFTYAKKFGQTVSAAINFNLHQIKITSYGNIRTYSVEAGLQYKVNEQLLIGTHISNPSQSGFDANIDAEIPLSLALGALYKFSDKVLLNTGIIKTLNSVTDFRCGLEYSIVSNLAFRGGMSVNPLRQFVGFGYKFSNLKVDAAASSHPQLGFSPQLALSYEF